MCYNHFSPVAYTYNRSHFKQSMNVFFIATLGKLINYYLIGTCTAQLLLILSEVNYVRDKEEGFKCLLLYLIKQNIVFKELSRSIE